MGRVLALAANPGSGGGTVPEEIARELERAGATVRLFGVDELEAAAASGAERLVVASGDGTIGLAAAAAASAGIPLAVVPSGTANDFARAMRIPSELTSACRLAALGMGLKEVDLARMDGRPFVNAASAGLAVHAGERAQPLKKRLGPLAYAVGALRAGVFADPVRCRVTGDGRELFAGRAWQVIVACSGAFGGGSRLESADPRDGVLDVAVLKAGLRARLVVHAYGLRAGRITSQRGVRHGRALRVDIDVAPGTRFNVDGEILTAGPSTFRVEPHAFRVVVA
jgi:diacylglycerol kinase (ATP)